MIIDSITLPALLEMLAEECSELSHASLKYSRLLRGENPTPKTDDECVAAVKEEIPDVTLIMQCLSSQGLYSLGDILPLMEKKKVRWKERIEAYEGRKN